MEKTNEEKSVAIEDLKAAIRELNKELRKSVIDMFVKKNQIEGSNTKVYRFNFKEAKEEEITHINKNDLALEENLPDDHIEYFWIKYNAKNGERMKWNFFYRDVDKNTRNVHVIPGLFEQYKYDEDFKKATPYVEVKNEKAVIYNVKYTYSSFADHDEDGGWWVPTSDRIPVISDDYTYDEKNDEKKEPTFMTINNLKTIFEKFNNFYENEPALSNFSNKCIEGLGKTTMGNKHNKLSKKYKPLFRYLIKTEQMICSMDYYKIFYFENYGFFIQFNCINFTKEYKDIITDYPIIRKDTDNEYPIIRKETDNYEDNKVLSIDTDPNNIKEELKSFLKNQKKEAPQ